MIGADQRIEGPKGFAGPQGSRIHSAPSTLVRRTPRGDRDHQTVDACSGPRVSAHARTPEAVLQSGDALDADSTRRVEDNFIPLSPEERELYDDVETYISETYNAAALEARNAVGFVMTIYRRRLASSFYALRQTLEMRKEGVGAFFTAADETRLDENVADLVEAGEDFDPEAAVQDKQRALAFEEIATIRSIIDRIGQLPVDSKAARLLAVLQGLNGTGYPQVMVFTQFTDTMDYLRNQVARAGKTVMCFSARGGEIRGADGVWTRITRDEVKRRFREGRSEVLVCTDAAAEGLNFQFCGALVNYDMPWNPMRVEQGIGRIDRLGQRFADIRIVNLHYEDTIEADVYAALRLRISIFENVVGGLQPILTVLPRLIEGAVLARSEDPAEKRRDALTALEGAIGAGEASAVNLDDFADEDIVFPARPDPPIALSDFRHLLDHPKLLPRGSEASPLDGQDYRFFDGELPRAVRITVDREFYEMHADSVEFWTPGNPTFPDLKTFRTQD